MKKIALTLTLGLMGGLGGSALFYVSFQKPQLSPLPEAQIGLINHTTTNTGRDDLFTSAPLNLSHEKVAQLSKDFVLASSLSTQSVVYIKTVSETQGGVSWFDYFFNGGGSQQVTGSGSGVIFRSDGHVVTNNHVVGNSEKIEVVYNRRSYPATIVGTDPSSDLAVLKIEGENFPAIKLGSSRETAVGEWVLAVGNPFNLNSTVTAGIVSAKGRDIGVVREQFPLESFIQTDAAINPGNSGGALVNTNGELIGINTAILSRTGSYTGYGFAVPVDIVKKIVGDLIRYGRVQKAFFGAEISDLDFEMAQKLNAENVSGIAVAYIYKEGAANLAGLQKGDVITHLDGLEVETRSLFDEMLSYRNPGDKLKVNFFRDGKAMEKELILTNEEGTGEMLENRAIFSNALGASFEAISKLEKNMYEIAFGVRISRISSGMIRKIGVEDGFILTFINGKKVESAEQAISLITETRGTVKLEGKSRSGRWAYYSYYY